jgi:hypothetical protein
MHYKHRSKLWNLDGKCVFKSFGPPPTSDLMTETRELKKEDLNHLDKLRYAPIIVQEKIDKGQDIRVNKFGEKVYAASTTNNKKEANLDWRLDLTLLWNLPKNQCDMLLRLMKKLHLHYGCIDLRQKPDGTFSLRLIHRDNFCLLKLILISP